MSESLKVPRDTAV